MAYINTYRDKWRAQVQVVGSPRESKTFETKEDAEEWATRRELFLKRKVDRLKAGKDSFLLSMIPPRLLDAIDRTDYTHAEIVDSPIPVKTVCGVYFLIKGSRVVYVGQSVDVFRRISKHLAAGKAFDSFNYLTCDESMLDEVERSYIEALMPAWNETMGAARRKNKAGRFEAEPESDEQ